MADGTSGVPPLPRRRRGQLRDEVWTVLQEAGQPLTAGQVRERLGRPPAYSTVVTTLARLYTEGILTRARDGRAHRYAPSTTEAGLVARRMQHALDDHDDRRAVLAHFVSALDGEDETVLKDLLEPDSG
ncbi:BlaI/MecI/CopY family transcriptional regulator [Pseudonocardia sp. KRD291]|uniref:BlaI/MecI/CopY family transcriptional regulator n=1 Tax=Pseudonocardia sp. KRD291 TaxID=2792007 RepID=UPI001C4A4FDD|nr:BlaI/MecI/CopY family transcriptional regulator [Pseudonocardia sp. KRD291]MBW0105682.1 BlaI/MecI/CopY family transcriptional regulator [Pseudonocardia sp. KRD291]